METGNTVRVHFYSIKFEYLVSDTLGNGGCGWISSDMYAIINVTYSDWQIHRWPEHFVRDIDGDDAFFIDEASIQYGWKDTVYHDRWGQDGYGGWCLSTDSEDNFGSSARKCFRFLRFDSTNGLVYGGY